MKKLPISSAVSQRLEELVSGLRGALGDELCAVLVYGSAARGDWGEGSDVDVIVVVGKATRERLEAIGQPLALARFSARIEAMVLERGEIAGAADVFPLLYRDVQRHHVVVHGSDPFAELTIERRHLRIRIEQELREALIRSRRAVSDALGSPEMLRALVSRKLKQVRATLHALLELEGVGCEDDLRSVLEHATKRYDVPPAALLSPEKDPAAAYDALVTLLGAAIAAADRVEAD